MKGNQLLLEETAAHLLLYIKLQSLAAIVIFFRV